MGVEVDHLLNFMNIKIYVKYLSQQGKYGLKQNSVCNVQTFRYIIDLRASLTLNIM